MFHLIWSTGTILDVFEFIPHIIIYHHISSYIIIYYIIIYHITIYHHNIPWNNIIWELHKKIGALAQVPVSSAARDGSGNNETKLSPWNYIDVDGLSCFIMVIFHSNLWHTTVPKGIPKSLMKYDSQYLESLYYKTRVFLTRSFLCSLR